jgi:hypothetical protein
MGALNRAASQLAYRYYEPVRAPSLSLDGVKRRLRGFAMLEHVMRAGNAFENPALLFKAAFDVPAVGEHFPLRENA